MSDLTIRAMTDADADAVLAIYQAGMDGGNASFEHTAPTWPDFHASKLTAHRLVAVDGQDTVLGWVAVSPVSSRAVYAGVVEHSVYVDPAHHGRGIGRTLLRALFASTEAAGIWTIQSGIFPENEDSLSLHRAAGFEVVGIRRRIGRMTYGPLEGRWRDVVLVERRSLSAGR